MRSNGASLVCSRLRLNRRPTPTTRLGCSVPSDSGFPKPEHGPKRAFPEEPPPDMVALHSADVTFNDWPIREDK
ncbi:hypothetical protein GCM10027056_07420 [Glaciibacter psychrotolerans]